MKILFFRLQVSPASAALLFCLFLASFTTGCSRRGVDKMVDCSAEYSAIVASIGRYPELFKYTNVRITDEVVILWEDVASHQKACPGNHGSLRIIASSHPDFNSRKPFVFVERLYYDEDAAFIGLHLVPSGKNVDALMRKKNGTWRVVESTFWEE